MLLKSCKDYDMPENNRNNFIWYILEIITRGKGNRCVAISIGNVASFLLLLSKIPDSVIETTFVKKISLLRFILDFTVTF